MHTRHCVSAPCSCLKISPCAYILVMVCLTSYCMRVLCSMMLLSMHQQLWALLHYILPDVFTLATAPKFEEGFDLLRGICHPQRLRQVNISTYRQKHTDTLVYIDKVDTDTDACLNLHKVCQSQSHAYMHHCMQTYIHGGYIEIPCAATLGSAFGNRAGSAVRVLYSVCIYRRLQRHNCIAAGCLLAFKSYLYC